MSDEVAYPSDDQLSDAADDTGIPIDVLIRDTVRLVEIRNLLDRGFLASDSVLAGSMALRGFGSPRFTIVDADFSTSTASAGRRRIPGGSVPLPGQAAGHHP
jgi:hypothetical protein